MKEYSFEEMIEYDMKMEGKPIAIGQRVFVMTNEGYKFGIIFRIKGEQKPETVKRMDFSADGKFEVILTGGNALFDIVWDDGTISPRIPERHIRGEEKNVCCLVPEVANADEIRRRLGIFWE